MKKCEMCEGVGSIPDSFEGTTERERIDITNTRTFALGWVATILVLLAAFVHGCPHGCVQTPDGKGAIAP